MPNPVYADFLTEASERRLTALLRDLPHPVALVGGHAVRLLVRDAWKVQYGTEYFGSRDIDVVYEVDPSWTKDKFRKSAAGQAPARMASLGFTPWANNRFGVIISADGTALAEEPGPPKFRGLDYDTLYVDPLVTRIHPASKQVLGYHPTDEPLVSLAFEDPSHRTLVRELGNSVYLPSASLLVATKLNSFPNRTKDDKAVKDLCDLYALIQYGGTRDREIRATIHRLLGARVPELVQSTLTSPQLPTAASHLDLEEGALRAVIGPLALR